MIAEEITSKKSGGNVKKLIDYITDTAHQGEKMAWSNITNCISDDIDLAIIEMKLTQVQNTRTQQDKTFHMVISFPPGEVPTREKLEDIEQTLAESVGMGHHQRISAAHTNTDNFHLHVAINKIDPVTHNIANNYYYQKDMMNACTELELKHNLQQNTRSNERKSSRSSQEYHAGEQSLESWCRDNLKVTLEEKIKSVSSWDDIHAVFHDAGLTLQKSGRGLVVHEKETNVAVKASAVTRQLSLHQLEKKIGAFRPAKSQKEKVSAYSAEKKANSLFQQFQTFRSERQQTKQDVLASLKETVTKQRQLARVENQLKRQKIQASHQSPAQKRAIYTRLAENNRQHLRVIASSYAAARKTVYADYGNMTYQQYLCYQAANGNEEALATLRAGAQSIIKHQGLSGEGDKRITSFDAVRVDKHGVIAYQVGQHAILDNGKVLTCRDDSLMADKHLLEMAVAKYGRNLTLNGSEAFKARIQAAAEQLNMDVVLNGQSTGEHDLVQQFIKNRNLDRVQNKKIQYHERFTDQLGAFSYQGYRNVGQQSVVLLKQGNTLYVKEVSRKELVQYRAQKVGTIIDTRTQPKPAGKAQGIEID